MLSKIAKIHVISCFALLILGQLGTLTSGSDGRLYVFDLYVMFSSFILWNLISIKYKKFSLPKVLLLLLLFSAIAFLSWIRVVPFYSTESLLAAFFYLARFVSYTLCVAVIWNLLKLELIDIKFLRSCILSSGTLLAAFGFVQLLVLPDFTVLDASLGWDPHQNRLAATFFDPNFVGGYLALCLAVFLFHTSKATGGRSTLEYLIFFFVPLLALFFTFSRSSWGMFAVVVFVYGVFRSPKLILLALLVGFFAYFAVPRVQTRISGITDPADSAHYRLISWNRGVEIARENLWFGIGFNTLRYVQGDYGFFEDLSGGGNSGAGVDSSFLFVLVTTGIIGFFVFVLGYFYPLVEAIHSKSMHIPFVLSVLGGLFLQSQFINALFYPQILFLWLLSVSCLLRTER